ncbi:hypothetical protein HD806DRAFT_513832 [Xylariaceae sp. AK1471]|nr:hypothetical protein HD806DRAFT_513832 [Xylariaceae sp. AK1471]
MILLATAVFGCRAMGCKGAADGSEGAQCTAGSSCRSRFKGLHWLMLLKICPRSILLHRSITHATVALLSSGAKNALALALALALTKLHLGATWSIGDGPGYARLNIWTNRVCAVAT